MSINISETARINAKYFCYHIILGQVLIILVGGSAIFGMDN